jgi:hypothetical protein
MTAPDPIQLLREAGVECEEVEVFAKNRQARRLRDCDITLHALDSYLNRVPEARASTARAELCELTEAATFCHRRPTGEEEWRAKAYGRRLRLIVHRVARRAPLLLTVIAEDMPL